MDWASVARRNADLGTHGAAQAVYWYITRLLGMTILKVASIFSGNAYAGTVAPPVLWLGNNENCARLACTWECNRAKAAVPWIQHK